MPSAEKKFSKVYDKYIAQIYRFVLLKVSSQEIAEDLSSETFLKTWNVFKKKKPKIENVQAFLYKVARNLIADHYRKNSKAQIVPLESVQLINHKIDLEGEAMLKSDLDNIRQALSDLSDDYQNVIIWHYLDDLSITEIGQISGRTEGNVRVLLHRAKKALKDKIEI